jgi:hypothetical protein
MFSSIGDEVCCLFIAGSVVMGLLLCAVLEIIGDSRGCLNRAARSATSDRGAGSGTRDSLHNQR